MIATHRLKDSQNRTAGFMIDGRFHNLFYTRKKIKEIRNLSIAGKGRFHARNRIKEAGYKDTVMHRDYHILVKKNPFKRDIQKELLEWKNKNSGHILRLDGARRCGKTTELLKFAYKNYDQVIYINLARDSVFSKLYKYPDKADVMYKYCKLCNLPDYTDSRNTILLIDEIQESSSVWNVLEDFNAKLKCDLAVSGSYLGRVLMSKAFFVIAPMDCYTMYPLSFREFCRVYDKELLLDTINLFGKSEDQDYQQLDELYQIYIQIGGYPDVVKQYRQTESIEESLNAVENIIRIVNDESAVYMKDARDKNVFEQVYQAVLSDMVKNKRGTGKRTTDEIVETITKKNQLYVVNRDEVINAVTWLGYCRLLGYVNLVVDGDIQNISFGRRMYFMDCGILNCLAKGSGLPDAAITGLLAETFVYNELNRLKNKISPRKGICFSVYGNYELDFMFVSRENIVYGIEVKAKSGSHKSLNVFLDRHFIERGVVANFSKGGDSGKFITIPVYTVGCRFPYQ